MGGKQLMPMQRSLYPANWNSIARRVKRSANWHCDRCDRPCLLPGEDLSDFWIRLNWPIDQIVQEMSDDMGRVRSGKATRFILTTAHLNHNPPDCSADNLIALCAPCHCRMDLRAMPLKKQLKRERSGQLNMFTPPR